MKMCNSNIGIEVYHHYIGLLSSIYDEREADAMLNILFEHYINHRKVMLLADNSIRLSESQLLDIHFGVKALLKHKPIQYIIGETDFYGFTIKVDSRTLIPRPETEELVKWIIDENNEALQILDIGTGSGCIAIVLSKLIKNSTVYGCDKSIEAIELACQNAEINSSSVQFFQCDILSQNIDSNNKFDIIVSNPPYIGNSERNVMQPNVLEYEPNMALFVPDSDVLLFYRTICQHAINGLLKQGGKVYFEINELYGKELAIMAESYGFDCGIKKDINEKSRMARLIWTQ